MASPLMRAVRDAQVPTNATTTATTLAALPRGENSVQPSVDFNRDVRPILSDRCFGCHGPDAEHGRRAGLRLDTEEGSRATLPSGARAIVAGDLDASEAVQRILSDDPDDVMPPPELKRPLTEAERDILVRWIAEGAKYAPHWAFVAPKAPAQSASSTEQTQTTWPRDPFDALMLERMTAAGLAPEREADRATLLRRASLALTGLPPTPEEVDAFVADTSPDAYERRVDVMLATPRAAEHRATVWLDLARFADTFGYQSDGDSFTWPWRDWLLDALERNMPYDKFASALIAGDLLPAASHREKQSFAVASAFNRLHRMTEEGGSISEEFRQEGIADRVSTFGTTFLGLTLECARCHDHKYDPIPTREFYGLAAMFGKIDENGLKSFAHHFSAPPPFVRLASDEAAQRTNELRAAMLDAERAYRTAQENAAREIGADRARSASVVELPTPAAKYAFDALENGRTPNAIDAALPATTDRGRPEQLGQIALAEGKLGRALAFDGDGGVSLAGLAGFTRHDPVSFAFWIKPSERNARAALLHTAGFYTNDADGSGLELLIADGRLRWSVIHLWPGSAASIEMDEELPVGAWTHVVATYDGLSRAEGLQLFVNGRRVRAKIVRDALEGNIAGATLEVGSRSRDAGFRGGMIDELAVWRAALSPAEAALAAGVSPDASASLAHDTARATAEEAASLRTAQRALAAHLDTLPAFMTMRDSPFAPPTFVLKRGAYDQPDRSQEVTAGAIQAVLPRDFSRDATRLELAQWLVDPANPLAARVEVNRLWTQVFGRGLVETAENFGVNGTAPTHPEVLDLLAHDFARGTPQSAAWDTRALLRRLVLSATFRQSSATSDAKRVRDPRNELLARGPSVRLSAEQLRDSTLFASGLLVEKLGGPSVKPWQQPGLVAEAGGPGGYTPDTGDAAHRRSLYTYRKRTVPPPTMLAFDAGSREACMPRRSATNTPLQALAIMNDFVFTECAQALANRVMREVGDAAELRDARITRAFRLACARIPTTVELDALRTLVAERVASGEQDERAALALATTTIFASDALVMSR
jgi:mono/diheme cytochrome c family protein